MNVVVLGDYAATLEAAAPPALGAWMRQRSYRLNDRINRAWVQGHAYAGDIPWATAVAAFSGTSHVPEQRAYRVLYEYAEHLDAVRAELERAAEGDAERLAEAVDLFATYRDGYRSRYRAALGSRAGLVSSMIAGPANFPVRQQEKRGAASDRRWSELSEWSKRARADALRALAAVKTAQVESEPASVRLERTLRSLEDAAVRGPGFTRAIERRKGALVAAIEAAKAREARESRVSVPVPAVITDLEAKIAKRTRDQEVYKAVNAIIRKKLSDDEKVEAIRALGMGETTARKLLLPDFAGRVGIPSYALQNNLAEIKRLEGRLKAERERLAVVETVREAELTGEASASEFPFPGKDGGPGGTVYFNVDLDRVQILYDVSRVPRDLYETLRRYGFVFSPREKAFQRRLNQQGVNAASIVTGIDLPWTGA
jgi:hypothetical protein